MADLDEARLPSVLDAKQIQKARSELAAEREREDDESKLKRSTSDEAEWTNRGGMVEQQRSAIEWVKAAQEHKKAGTELTDRKQPQADKIQETTDLAQRRQVLLRQFGREIEDGFQNEIGEDSGRERTRG